jgi:hypothetical protein
MLTKFVIDIDSELLRRSADAQHHAFEESWDHITKESTGHVPTILATLIPEGPWAWAIMTHPQVDGSISLPIHTSYEGIEEMYRMIRGTSDVLSVDPIIDVRGTWYSFQEDYARSRLKATGEERGIEMILVLPVTTGPGITGELAWTKMDRALLGKDLPLAQPEKTSVEMRRHMLTLHDRFLVAFRTGDASALVEGFSRGCQSAIRDYVEDTGTLIGLDDLEGLRTHYQRFFDRFEVHSAEILQRVVQDWYLFAEIRVEVVVRYGDEQGGRLAFHTASLFVPGKEDKFIVHIGHGTDLAGQPGP